MYLDWLIKDGEPIVSDREFEEYLIIQQDGDYNMFDPRAQEQTELSDEQWFFIMRNYEKLMVEYKEIYNQYFQ